MQNNDLKMKKLITLRSLNAKAAPSIFKSAHLLRSEMTIAEKILWNELRNRKLGGVKFRRQHPLDIFIADFYCHEFRLVIEVDGSIHLTKEQREKDKARSNELEKIGIKVIRFKNEDVFERLEWVLEQIKTRIKSPLL